MTYARLIGVEPESGQILRLILDDDHSVRIRGTKKQIRKAVSGGNLDKISVIYDRDLCMSKEDWLLLQPLLLAKDFGPMLNRQFKLSYAELNDLPRWAWIGGLKSFGRFHQRLFTYHPVDFRRYVSEKAENSDLHNELYRQRPGETLAGLCPSPHASNNDQMTLWRITYDLSDNSLNIDSETGASEYFFTKGVQ